MRVICFFTPPSIMEQVGPLDITCCIFPQTVFYPIYLQKGHINARLERYWASFGCTYWGNDGTRSGPRPTSHASLISRWEKAIIFIRPFGIGREIWKQCSSKGFRRLPSWGFLESRKNSLLCATKRLIDLNIWFLLRYLGQQCHQLKSMDIIFYIRNQN